MLLANSIICLSTMRNRHDKVPFSYRINNTIKSRAYLHVQGVEPQALALCQTWDVPARDQRLVEYLRLRPSLQAQYATQRTLTQVPVTLPSGQELALSAGAHSELIRDIVMQFAPQFVPRNNVLYLDYTRAKAALWETDAFAALNLHFDPQGKMPNVVLHYPAQNWLFLVEAVTSHGPMDALRRADLAQLFQASIAGLLYVTDFPHPKGPEPIPG